MAAGEADRGWDFFISYTQADRMWAEWIAWVLEEDGHKVLVQAWDFVPGTNWINSMHEGAHNATRTIAVLSPGYLASVYGGTEWQAAWASDPTGAQRKLLVVRVAHCDQPGLLAGVVGVVDLFKFTDADAAQAQLLEMVTKALAGRAKPATAPPFPGAARAITGLPHFPGAEPPGPHAPQAQQRVWGKVPPRNPHFTGRASELGKVARGLAAGTRVMVHSVHGLGGVGKTQLVTEYAHAHAGGYEVVWWIAAEQTASIPNQFEDLATQLGLEPVSDPDSLRTQVHHALQSVPRWLLIFDNADSAGNVRPWLPAGPTPAGVAGHVLVTSRRGGFGALGQVLDLDVIPPADALRLLRTRVPKLDHHIGNQIAEELGRLPLALEQAAAYLDLSQIPATEYLQLLHDRAADLHRRGQVASRDDTIATLWDLSLQRLTRENPAAVQLLAVCAYLAPEPIPLDLFTNHPDQLPQPLSTAAADPVAFTDTVTALADYSLAKRTPAGLQVHRLVQTALRAQYPVSEDRPQRTGLMPLQVPGQPPWQAGGPLAVALRMLFADVPERIMGAPEAWPRWAVLLPHVLAAAAHFDQTSSPNADVTAETPWLLHHAGAYLLVHGSPGDAKPLLERALAIDEAAHGPDHPTVAIRLNDLAVILRDLGEPGQARALVERALAIAEATYGPDHPTVAADLGNLAAILRELGEAGQARPLVERALAIDEAAYGPDHPTVGTDLDNLAAILRDLGEPGQARPLQERALTITEATYGPDHPTVATRLNNLATILRNLGEPGQARPLVERALAIDEAAYGPDHPAVAIRLNNLALTLRELGLPGQAQPLQERALAITEATYGPDHPTVATRLNDLATILQDLGETGSARPLQERAQLIIKTRRTGQTGRPGQKEGR
jgi:tetratricopeptide (TPR) repeat protein